MMQLFVQGQLLKQKKLVDLFDTGNYHKDLNIKFRGRMDFFHFRGFRMPRCRSPPFLSEKQTDKKGMEETLWQKSITFMSEDKR